MLSDENKRYSDLIKAFAIFSKDKISAKLLLVGDGPERINYQKLVEELGITSNVIFTGYQADVSLFYNLMDIFALVSRNESFGLVLAEAMLNKLPVIATRVGGMKYIVEDGETGFLVEPKNEKEISEKLEILFESKELRVEMSEAGFQKAMINYTESNYIQNISTLFNSLIEKNK